MSDGSTGVPASLLMAADGPGLGAALRVQLRCAGVLLGLRGGGGIAGAADGLPGLLVELVLAAVGSAPADGGGVPTGLARGDAAERTAGGAVRGRRAGRAGRRRGGRRGGARRDGRRRGRGRRRRGRSGQLGCHALEGPARSLDRARARGAGVAALADAVVHEIPARPAAELPDLVVVHLVRALDPVGDEVLGAEGRSGDRSGRGAEQSGRRGGARQRVSERDDVSPLPVSLLGPGPRGPARRTREGATIRPVASRTRTAPGQPAVVRTYPGQVPPACEASRGPAGPNQLAKAGSSLCSLKK